MIIHWIAIYTLDRVIQCFNDSALVVTSRKYSYRRSTPWRFLPIPELHREVTQPEHQS